MKPLLFQSLDHIWGPIESAHVSWAEHTISQPKWKLRAMILIAYSPPLCHVLLSSLSCSVSDPFCA